MKRLVTVEEYAYSRSKRKSFLGRYGLVLLFLGPYLFFFLLFTVYPLIYGIVMSLMKYSISDPTQNAWRGFQNYITLLLNGNSIYNLNFWYSMKNTVVFAIIIVPVSIILPLVTAIMVNFQPKGYKVFRAIIYLPSILPVSSSGVIFIALFSTSFGYINQWFGTSINWLNSEPILAWIVIFLLCIWGGWGGNFVILSAGLKNVDKSLLEAASVDGCNSWGKILHVTLPCIKQQLILCIFTTIIGYFSLYGQVYVLTSGGPNVNIDGTNYWSTQTIMFYLQTLITGTQFDVYGMVSSMGILMGIFVGCITGIQLLVTRERKSGHKRSDEFAAYLKAQKGGTL